MNLLKLKKVNIPDDYLNKVEKNNFYNVHIIPNHPFRCAIVGGSGSGKTNLLVNFLTKRLLYKNYFDSIILICPTYLNQPIYELISASEVVTDISVDRKTGQSDVGDMISCILQRQEFWITKYGLSLAPKVLIIFDDVIDEKDAMNSSIMLKLLVKGRQYNISTVILSQSYTKIPRAMRLQLSNVIIMAKSFTNEAKVVSTEFSFEKYIEIIKRNLKDPFSFLHVNQQAKSERRLLIGLEHYVVL